jgi:SAM-dependent methyltransferase
MESGQHALERQLSRLLSLSREIYRKRPDLQDAFPDPEVPEYWTWLQTHGFTEFREIRDLSTPLPSRDVHRFVNPDAWGYLLCGASSYLVLCRAALNAGHTLDELGPVLDFGCGPGRTLRFLVRHGQAIRCVGIDVDRAAIEWCRASFPFWEFQVSGDHPPANLPAATFGLAYAISVFSHLSEESHARWLRELARLVRPRGLAVLTIHGRHSLGRASKDDAQRQLLHISSVELDGARSLLDSNGFAFVRQPGGHLNRDLYGITFTSEDYVHRQWSQYFEVIAYWPAGLDDWQDVVILRRRS